MTPICSHDIDCICIRGARTHNLRAIDVDLPLEQLTVITGVSGSGKSSLAWDTIFAAGRHRYLSTISPKTREFLRSIERPLVDSIDGLPPTFGIGQRQNGPRRRSTLATIVEVYDLLRVLYARVGQLHCPRCGKPVSSQSRDTIVNQVLRLEDRQKVLILSPIIRGQKGSHADVFSRIVRDGFVRARVDGVVVEAAAPPGMDANQFHDIDVVVDRLIIKDGIRSRLEESLDLAMETAQGQCIVSHESAGQWSDRLYSSRLACAECGSSFASLEPINFSFNSPSGACSECHGLGMISATLAGVETPQRVRSQSAFHLCPVCTGGRLSPLFQSVLIAGDSISGVVRLKADAALQRVHQWSHTLASESQDVSAESKGQDSTAARQIAARHILPEIVSRLQLMRDLGLDYLTLDRAGESLSTGEFQRARLAASLGNSLTATCYIVDEPTTGLHPRDTDRLLSTLFRLRDQGNTVIVVEHDLDIVRQADYVVEIGPGAGTEGGQLLSSGPPQAILRDPTSLSGQEFLRREQGLKNSATSFQAKEWITLAGATVHNLRDVTLRFPLRGVVCISGVSGSGKTSLVMRTLVPALRNCLEGTNVTCGPFRALHGMDHLSRVSRIDQSPLGRSSRSTPASYSGLWDEIRRVFAKTKEARLRGFTARRFSTQSPDGRCFRCAGRGTLASHKKNVLELAIRCPECNGKRFNRLTLGIQYRGLCVADVFDLSFDAAAVFFANIPRLAHVLSLFRDLGLGYLKLGQPSTTLSGGEAQRVKIATQLVTSQETPSTLFVLDEPTSGLHARDVMQLLTVFRRLVHEGHSVLVVEHNLDVIAAADWLVDMGPEAGEAGGRIVVEGAPCAVSQCPDSHTGRALRNSFATSP